MTQTLSDLYKQTELRLREVLGPQYQIVNGGAHLKSGSHDGLYEGRIQHAIRIQPVDSSEVTFFAVESFWGIGRWAWGGYLGSNAYTIERELANPWETQVRDVLDECRGTYAGREVEIQMQGVGRDCLERSDQGLLVENTLDSWEIPYWHHLDTWYECFALKGDLGEYKIWVPRYDALQMHSSLKLESMLGTPEDFLPLLQSVRDLKDIYERLVRTTQIPTLDFEG
jgi:hypothetical protein